MEYLFDNSLDAKSGSTGAPPTSYWLTSSTGNQTLTFDFLNKARISLIKVYPKARDTDYSQYRVLVSDDKSTWTQLSPWTTGKLDYLLAHEHYLDIFNRYIRFELTREGGWGVLLSEIEFYYSIAEELDKIECFVDSQNGSDNNDGLSSETAWSTITKATQNMPSADRDTITYVHIAPGTYRERIVIDEEGSFLCYRKVIYLGDPNCIHFQNRKQGTIRITGCNENGLSDGLAANLITANALNLFEIELKNLCLDGVDSGYVVYGSFPFSPKIDNCHITGHNGVYGVDAYNSTIFARNCAANKSNLYNCVVIGGVNSVYDSASSGSKLNNSLVFVPDVGVHTNQRTRNSLVYGAKTAYLSDTNTGYSSAICCKDGFGGGSTGTGNRYSCVETGVTTKQTESPLALFDVKIKPIAVDESMFLPKYELDYEDFKYNAPSIKLKGRSQYKIKASVQKGSFIKSLWIKSYNTNPELMPYIIVKFAGKDRIKEAICSVNWELLSICFDSAFDGVAELVLVTQDPNPESYTLFSDIY